jgi:PAS domain S-box-containing protein
LGISEDITERKQAEVVIQQEQALSDTIINSIPGTFYILDENGRYFRWNAYQRDEILGKPDDQMAGMNAIDTIHPEDRTLIQSRIANVLKEGTDETVESRVLLRGGPAFIWMIMTGRRMMIAGRPFLVGIGIDITERKRAEKERRQTLESLRRAVNTTIQVMVSAVEVRDPYTAGHQNRSADLARAIATEMGLPQETIEGIRMVGSIHDIGKLSIPAEILSKPTKLTNIEFSLIKEHSQKGYEMLMDVESPWPLAQIVYQHHERMDGSGYPRNLKGDDILIEARILAVSDVVEAMASHRPYRPALGLNAALAEIENNKGTLYDADVVDVCLRLFREKGFQLECT